MEAGGRGTQWVLQPRNGGELSEDPHVATPGKSSMCSYSLFLVFFLGLQCFGHLMRRADSSEKTLMMGKIEGEMVGWHH